MADYIKREDAVIKAKQAVFATFRYGKTPTENAVYENIDIAFKEQYLPSADVVEVKHGEWVDGGVDGVGACGIEYRYNKCSVCGYEYSFPMKYNFCPRCGADMRKDGE